MIGVLSVLGVAAEIWRPALEHFNLDYEFTVPAAFSAVLLGLCAVMSATLAVDRHRDWPMWFLSALFAVMAVDEAFSIHEKLEIAAGVDWPVLYAPVVLAGGAAFLFVARDLRHELVRFVPWIGGAFAWGIAQGLEIAEWDDADLPRPGYVVMMVVEEILEMAGSALWLFSLSVAVWSLTRRVAEGVDVSVRPR